MLITGKKADGYHGNVPLDSNNNLLVSSTVSGIVHTHNVAVGMGMLPGQTPWSKIGYNGNFGTTEVTLTPFAAAKYTFPAVSGSIAAISSSVQDESTTGTGIRNVVIFYLDSNYVEKSTASLALNGTTAVRTAETDIFRLQNIRGDRYGTGYVAAGNIVFMGAANATHGYIATGYTRQRQCVWTVPANKTLYVNNISFSEISNKGVRFTTRATYDEKLAVNTSAGSLFIPFHEILCINQSFSKELTIPTKLPEKVDLKVDAVGYAAGAVASCALRGWLQDN